MQPSFTEDTDLKRDCVLGSLCVCFTEDSNTPIKEHLVSNGMLPTLSTKHSIFP